MAWQDLVMRLDRPSCPEADGKAHISCIRPGDDGAPIAYVQGDAPGWESVGADGLARRSSPCEGCPARELPRSLVVRCMDIDDGAVTIHALAPQREDVKGALDAMTAAGQAPTIQRIRASEDDRRPCWVDLGRLSPRQWEALRAAQETGYFESGGGGVDALAEAMGCGRSAAHEHLRKALARLVDAVDRTGPAAVSQMR